MMEHKIQQEYSGKESIYFIDNILHTVKPRHIFLVTGKNSYQSSGLKEKLELILGSYTVTHFDQFSVNPNLEDIENGIKHFRNGNCDFVIAAGGGSTIDIAKSITILAAQESEPYRYVTKELSLFNPGKPVVAIPTTAGTGSEATHFAVVYIGETKYSLAHPELLLPDYVILDPSLTYTLPPPITASTGMDALCQAIESYWSILSTEESKYYAGKAIPLILENIPRAVNTPTEKARMAMMTAANAAGKAINISKTTACHAISYPFTSYFNVPHGHAVALTLGEMFVYNNSVTEDDCTDARGINYVRKTMAELTAMFHAHSAEEVNKRWCTLMDNIGLERSITKLGIKSEKNLNLIIKNGFNPERVKNNLRNLSEDSLRKILHNLK